MPPSKKISALQRMSILRDYEADRVPYEQLELWAEEKARQYGLTPHQVQDVLEALAAEIELKTKIHAGNEAKQYARMMGLTTAKVIAEVKRGLEAEDPKFGGPDWKVRHKSAELWFKYVDNPGFDRPAATHQHVHLHGQPGLSGAPAGELTDAQLDAEIAEIREQMLQLTAGGQFDADIEDTSPRVEPVDAEVISDAESEPVESDAGTEA